MTGTARDISPESAPRRGAVGREGLVWLVANLLLVRAGGIVATLILRRLLGPATSGVFDLATTPYRFFDSIRNFGIGPVLIYERRLTHDAADTGWAFNMALAVALVVVTNLFAHPVAVYYGHPGIERLLRLLSLAYVLSAVGSIHGFLLLRNLDLRARSIPGVGQVVISCTVAIIAAIWFAGSGPLVIRELLSALLGAILLWCVCPYRPQVRIVRSILRRQLRYSAWIGAGFTSLYIAQNADVFIAGHVIHSAADVGFYTTSWRLTAIVVGMISITVTSVVFPALSRATGDPSLFGKTLVTAVRQSAFVVLPTSFSLAALAPVMVVPLLGARWAPYRDDSIIIAILAIYGGERTISAIFFEGYKAIGKPWLMSAYNLIKAACIIPAMIVAAPHGIRAVAVVYLPVMAVEAPLALVLAHRVLRVQPRDVWNGVRASLLTSLLTAAVIVAAERWGKVALHASDLRIFALCMPLAIATYVVTMWLLHPTMLREARAILAQGLLPGAGSGDRRRSP